MGDFHGQRYQCWFTAQHSQYDNIWAVTQRAGGWLSSHPMGMMFWIPESQSYWIELLDPTARRYPERDYV
jgi:hypothetical protein